MKMTTLQTIAGDIAADRLQAAARRIDKALKAEPGLSWQRFLGGLAVFLRDPAHAPFASVLTLGNDKLPFLSFSGLPGDACPGAGDCLKFCYSFKAWRYPAAFARQAQNLVLIRHNPTAVFQAFDKYRGRGAIDFRLYVDGDFDSTETVNRWFSFLYQNDWLKAYGYSKSFYAILGAQKAPPNYRLNISSGHNSPPSIVAKIAALPITRGHFIAVDIGRAVKAADHGDRAHQAELRKVFGGKAFTCPGKCGECTPNGHACGSDTFKNIPIIIAAH
jgi:hypothetical protein